MKTAKRTELGYYIVGNTVSVSTEQLEEFFEDPENVKRERSNPHFKAVAHDYLEKRLGYSLEDSQLEYLLANPEEIAYAEINPHFQWPGYRANLTLEKVSGAGMCISLPFVAASYLLFYLGYDSVSFDAFAIGGALAILSFNGLMYNRRDPFHCAGP